MRSVLIGLLLGLGFVVGLSLLVLPPGEVFALFDPHQAAMPSSHVTRYLRDIPSRVSDLVHALESQFQPRNSHENPPPSSGRTLAH